MSTAAGLHSYGAEAAQVAGLPGHERWLSPGLSEAMVRFAARHEYARTAEDVLARRSRQLFLDARLAARLAEPVARILEEETGVSAQLPAFLALCQAYSRLPADLFAASVDARD